MYIALISLHALIMVGFHFLHFFEEDWTSEYVPGLSSGSKVFLGPKLGGGILLLQFEGPSSVY